ncbi:MAG: glycosyltransferase [Ginsengibacter sp.]
MTKILGITNFYSSLDPLCPQAIQKPAEILSKKGFDIIIFSPTPYASKLMGKRKYGISKLPSHLILNGIEIYHPHYFEIPKNILKRTAGYRYYYGINKMVSKKQNTFKPDIIHAHMCFPDGYAAMKFSEKFRMPYIITVRGTDLLTIRKFKSVKPIMLEILFKASRVIFPSNRIANQFQEYYSKANISVIPNGIDVNDFDNLNPLIFPELAHKKIIVSVSTLNKDKGIEINIKALAELVKIHDDIHYIIVGDGVERNNLNHLVEELNLSSYITFAGKVDHKKALEYIAFCNVFSLPGWNETFGLVYLEAMYLKKPIVATFNDGIDGAAKDGVHGFFAHARNIKEVTDALHKLLSSSELRTEMGLRGHEEVIKGYTWQKHAEEISKVYQQVRNESTKSI